MCVNPNVLRKEDTVLVKYLCHRKKKRIIALYVFDRILGKRIINNNIAFVFLIFKS